MIVNYKEKEAATYLATRRAQDEVKAYQRFKRLAFVLFAIVVIAFIVFSTY